MERSALGAAMRRVVRLGRTVGAVVLLALLAGCASNGYAPGGGWSGSSARQYRAPGPPGDPWGPYIREAATRFRIPDRWIREVMRQESGGHEYLDGQPITSRAGAMGLMQVMPETYDILRARYGLGGDPYDPHDNIMAGAAYIREMYDKYGSPAFLAAYNAGPGRLDAYLQNGEPLPDETVNYIASVAPRLGGGPAMTGPLSAYADTGSGIPGGGTVEVAAAAPAPVLVAEGTCSADAAYDPSRPCASYVTPSAPIAAPPVAVAVPLMVAAQASECDPDAAYDPSQPCQPASAASPDMNPAPVQVIQAASVAPVAAAPPPLVLSLPRRPAASVAGGYWGIQVGAFRSPDLARETAGGARASLPELLRGAAVRVEPTTPFGSTVLYRARLTGVSAQAAEAACARLRGQGTGCMVVAPGPI